MKCFCNEISDKDTERIATVRYMNDMEKLEEAKKYDLFLKLEKIGKHKALELFAEKKARQVYA